MVVELGTLILAWLGFSFLIAGPRQGVILITNYMLYFQLFPLTYNMTLGKEHGPLRVVFPSPPSFFSSGQRVVHLFV